jgi:class 3 adenylate cyclase
MAELSFLDFEELLTRAIEHPAAEAELWRRYGTRGAVLVCDFTGMVRRSDGAGIVRALALARAAERVMALSGTLVKRVADTLFVIYGGPAAALADALAARARLATWNAGRPDPIHACMGLGSGPVLLIPGVDVYGEEVNRAFVLGEEVAGGGEILVTGAFLAEHGPLPDGVGAHRAPQDREEEARFPFHLLGDYRS